MRTSISIAILVISTSAQTIQFETNNYLAGAFDPTFISRTLVANDGTPFITSATALQPDGKILVTGSATTRRRDGGLIGNHGDILRLNADGTLDPSFHPDFIASGTGFSFRPPLVQMDGGIVILIDGEVEIRGDGNVSEQTLIGLGPDGALKTVFHPGFLIDSLVSESAGSFVAASTEDRSDSSFVLLRRIFADGNSDLDFSVAIGGGLREYVEDEDGKLLILGQFTSVNGIGRTGLVRLQRDGTLDETFTVSHDMAARLATNGFHLAIGNDAQILVATGIGTIAVLRNNGSFEKFIDLSGSDFVPVKQLPNGEWLLFAGLPPAGLSRMNADGTLDEDFSAPISPILETIQVQADGKIVVAGHPWYNDPADPATTARLYRLLPEADYSYSFRSMTRFPSGEVKLSFNVPPHCYDCNYTLQTSSDLREWRDLIINVHPQEDRMTVDFNDDAKAEQNLRFYRVRIVPL